MKRLERNPSAISDRLFDVAIVGGGITGAGVARHAALAGLSTLLIEAADFSSGTSSRSTKLIHGGLRYLAMGDIGLVREGALERKSLKIMAPHLTQPQWMVVPAQSRAAMLKLRAGITLYEKLGAVDPVDRHQNWDRAQLIDLEPLLDRSRFPFACAYREYLTDDARLVMTTLRSAAMADAVICNYAKLSSFSEETPEVLRLEVDDLLTGERLAAQARVLVNAAGPWVEAVQSTYQGDQESRAAARLHLSKGVHVTLPRERLPVNHMVMTSAADDRPVFAIPRGQVTYVGTTDTSVSGGPGYWPDVTREDVDYLLQPLNSSFDCDELSVRDVVGSWAGLRPLVHQAGKSPKEMSRKDEIWRSLPRVVSIAGGKLTGYRKMAEQVLDQVGQILERDITLDDPLAVLPGGDVADVHALVADLRERYAVTERNGMRLARLYGSEAGLVLGEAPTPITDGVFEEEVRWSVTEESAVMLEDVVYRRLRIPGFRPSQSQQVAVAAASIMAELLGWNGDRLDEELRKVRDRLQADLYFKPG